MHNIRIEGSFFKSQTERLARPRQRCCHPISGMSNSYFLSRRSFPVVADDTKLAQERSLCRSSQTGVDDFYWSVSSTWYPRRAESSKHKSSLNNAARLIITSTGGAKDEAG